VGPRLLIFRDAVEKGDVHPLNCIFLGQVKYTQTTKDTIVIGGIKQYTLKFLSETECRDWVAAFKLADEFCLTLFTASKNLIQTVARREVDDSKKRGEEARRDREEKSLAPPPSAAAGGAPKPKVEVLAVVSEPVKKKPDFMAIVKETSSQIKKLYCWGANDIGQLGNGVKGKNNWVNYPCVRSVLHHSMPFLTLSVSKDRNHFS
jgi:hypothetical protein